MPDDIHSVGTLSTVIQLLRLPDGTIKVLVEGKRRAVIRQFVKTDGFFEVEVEPLPDQGGAVARAGGAGARGELAPSRPTSS